MVDHSSPPRPPLSTASLIARLAGIGAVVMMFTFVVPKFANLLKRADDLPWLASAVLNTGMFLRQWYSRSG